MDIPTNLTFDTPLVDPGYVSERQLDPLTSPVQAPRFVRDGQRDRWWMQASAFDTFTTTPPTTIDLIDNGLRN
ncbi:MAG: hypothetical protein HY816_02425 [Candidatus Wallbacteria bacterium]|nr:hypothetical protein [Candidatus Wallbacteria bacterium]